MMRLISLLLIFTVLSCSRKEDATKSVNKQKATKLLLEASKLAPNKGNDALNLLDKAIAIDNNYWQLHSSEIDIYLRQKKYEKALSESEISTDKAYSSHMNKYKNKTKKEMIARILER